MQHQPWQHRGRWVALHAALSESATGSDENPAPRAANALRTRSELDIRARIRHDNRDAVMRDAAPRGAGLTRRRVTRS
jgi:hypothetical protein